MLLFSQKNKKIGIYGLARTGIEAYKALSEIANVICYDDSPKTIKAFEEQFLCKACPLTDQRWQQLDLILLSPAIPLKFPYQHDVVKFAQKHNIQITSDIELLFHEFPDAYNIGITGTNGKSTTTALIYHILTGEARQNFQCGGNIGIPVLSLKPPSSKGGFVLEISSFQLDLLNNFKLDVAVLLNITQDHIDRHNSLEEYTKVKSKIFTFLKKTSCAIIAINNELTSKIYEELKLSNPAYKLIPVGVNLEIPCGISINEHDKSLNIIDGFFNQRKIFSIKCNKSLLGAHNYENIICAYAAARFAGIEPEVIISRIGSFEGLIHRMQLVDKLEGINFYNDSKATNSDSAAKSLGALRNIYWLAGGVAKEGGIKDLLSFKDNIIQAYLYGAAAENFANTLKGIIPFKVFKTLDEAFNESLNDAMSDNIHKEKNILLAPACASFDQFKDFEERGNKFINLVKNFTQNLI